MKSLMTFSELAIDWKISGLLTIFQVSNFAPKSDSSQQPVTNDSPMLQHEFFNSQFKHNNILLSQKIHASENLYN